MYREVLAASNWGSAEAIYRGKKIWISSMQSAITCFKRFLEKELSLSCYLGLCWWGYQSCYENFADESVITCGQPHGPRTPITACPPTSLLRLVVGGAVAKEPWAWDRAKDKLSPRFRTIVWDICFLNLIVSFSPTSVSISLSLLPLVEAFLFSFFCRKINSSSFGCSPAIAHKYHHIMIYLTSAD